MVVIPEYHMEPKDSGRIYLDTPQTNRATRPRQRIPDPSGETELIKKLVAAGFHIVDQEQLEAIRYGDQIKATINGEHDLAILLGQQFKADIMITGEAISQSSGNAFQGLFSSRARIEAKAIDLKSGRLLFTDGLYASAMDRSEIIAEKIALQKAGAKLGELFVEKLKALSDKSSANLQLVVTGLSYKDFIAFKNTVIASIKGAKIIEQSSFVKKQAFLVVEIGKDAESFAADLVTTKSKLFNSEVIEMSQDSITVAVSLKK